MSWLKKADQVTSIRTEDLNVNFDELIFDYVIYMPGDNARYVTRIGDIKLGFGPRYLLMKLLDEVKQVFPETIPTSEMDVRDIPKLSEPIIRRLGTGSVVLKVKPQHTEKEEKVEQAHQEAFPYNPVPGDEVTTGSPDSHDKLNNPGKF